MARAVHGPEGGKCSFLMLPRKYKCRLSPPPPTYTVVIGTNHKYHVILGPFNGGHALLEEVIRGEGRRSTQHRGRRPGPA